MAQKGEVVMQWYWWLVIVCLVILECVWFVYMWWRMHKAEKAAESIEKRFVDVQDEQAMDWVIGTEGRLLYQGDDEWILCEGS